jgi:hypothetical protein
MQGSCWILSVFVPAMVLALENGMDRVPSMGQVAILWHSASAIIIISH